MDILRREFRLDNVRIVSALPPVNTGRGTAQVNQPENGFTISQQTRIDPVLYKSALGTPVYTNLQFTGKNYEDQYGRPKQFPTLVFDTVIMTVNQSKNIVTTAIQGRDGTVKEYIGMGDYVITINGIITGANGHYPVDEVRELKKMLDAPIAIDVVSWYLQNLDISTIVIKDYDIPQVEGGYSYQRFSINALSDTPQEIQIFN